MSWFTGILVYVIAWWVVLFAVLPWGIRVPDEQKAGHASSAPSNPRLWLKAAVTTVIAAIIWLGIYYLVESDWLSFRAP
jgi:predicted secreted protein